jgi:DNA-binding HxlR family transcriptional regulator/predicted transcriptional regulator
MVSVMPTIQKTQNSVFLSGVLKSLDTKCLTCAPITPFECITRCKVYKLKNELWHLRESMMNNPDYIKELFNVLKNETRLQILQAIVADRHSLGDIQKELKKAGCSQSQNAILEEYLHPLMALGIINELCDQYSLTSFGGRLTKLIGCFPAYAPKLPTHSECYEENLLQYLLLGPKTFEEIESVVSPKNLSRTLRRLHSVRLIKTPTQRDYIFFFKTIRNPDKETLRVTERKIYDAIAAENGVSAGKLSNSTGLSKRVIYRCMRRLRGKKLVFERRNPKRYDLTCIGKKLAYSIHKLQQEVEDTCFSFQQ